ncbi:MAG TPA: STY0301 family protein [Stellaceae bacterium]
MNIKRNRNIPRWRTTLASAAALAVGMTAHGMAATDCPVKLGGRAFSHLDLAVGSPDGKLGTIAQNGSEFDKSGKHGRDLFPLGGEKDVFLRCRYDGGRVLIKKLPPGTRQCEVDYHYVSDYDTRADRIFCR